MADRKFSWKDPRFTYADALSGARLVMLPYLIYALAAKNGGLAAVTLLAIIGTDLIDGTVARKTGQAREFGVTLDSTIDFLIIYSVFTTFFAVGILPWWKWLVIFICGAVMGVTEGLSVLKADDVKLGKALVGKKVGQVQVIYLFFLLGRMFWLKAEWAPMVDNGIFALLAVLIPVNIFDYGRRLVVLFKGNQPK